MLNVNFVPEDYVKNSESRRLNYMYLMLFGIVMLGLASVFGTIKLRQRGIDAKEAKVNAELNRRQEDIKRVEEIQAKTDDMMKAAMVTSELIEPVPRSVLLATLTNKLPSGASLLSLDLIQKQPKHTPTTQPKNKFDKNKKDNAKPAAPVSPERLIETYITIKGVAPTDIQVASYIESLGGCTLLENVALVESKESKFNESSFREFKLTATLRNTIHLTKEDVGALKNSPDDINNRFIK